VLPIQLLAGKHWCITSLLEELCHDVPPIDIYIILLKFQKCADISACIASHYSINHNGKSSAYLTEIIGP
jgi:hypothetical protein